MKRLSPNEFESKMPSREVVSDVVEFWANLTPSESHQPAVVADPEGGAAAKITANTASEDAAKASGRETIPPETNRHPPLRTACILRVSRRRS